MSNDPLWQWPDLISALNPEAVQGETSITGISIDSRTIEKGDLFIALAGDPGPKFNGDGSATRDGHDFIPAAVSNQAAALMVSRPVDTPCPYLRVGNTLEGLWQLGHAGRARMSGQVVAITGSSGKTTTRQWLEQVTRAQVKTHASVGSYNNHWGVPLSLARMPADSEIGIFEVGTNHPGEISPLSELVSPDISILLNVLPAHIGNFGSLDAIRQEKLTIADGLGDEGILMVPDDLDISGVQHSGRVVRFGSDPAAEAILISVEYEVNVEAEILGESVRYSLALGGVHRVQTSLAVLTAAKLLGLDLVQAAKDISGVDAPTGRGNVLEAAGITLIDDSYNANPASMGHAIRALVNQSAAGKKIAILGEMLELGDDGRAAHEEMIQLCEGLDEVITVGEGFSGLSSHHYGSVKDIEPGLFLDLLAPGDVVLVKGSNRVFWVHKFVQALFESIQKNPR